MMSADQICITVQEAVKKAESRSLTEICHAHGILFLQSDMGSAPDACKGFFLQQDGVCSVMLNSSLDEDTKNFVLAHELGHAFLHQSYTDQSFHDFGLFTDHSQLEYEANLFAADLLLEDDAVCSVLCECDDFFHAARLLRVPPQILDFKLRIMKKCGVLPLDAPIVACGDFLKSYSGNGQKTL